MHGKWTRESDASKRLAKRWRNERRSRRAAKAWDALA